MASIATGYGHEVRLYSNGSAIGGEQAISFGVTTNMIPTDTKDNTTWTEVMPGRKSFTCSASGIIDESDTGYEEILDKSFDNTLVTAVLKTIDATRQFSFSAYVQDLSWEGPHDGPISWNCTLAPTGTVTEEAVA